MAKIYKPARNGFVRDPFNNHRMQVGKQTHRHLLNVIKKDAAGFKAALTQAGYAKAEAERVIQVLEKTRVPRKNAKDPKEAKYGSKKAGKGKTPDIWDL